MEFLYWVFVIATGTVLYSFLGRSKNRRQMEKDRRNLRNGSLNDRQLKEIFRKLDTYKNSTAYAVAAYGFFYKQFFDQAQENYELFKPEMKKRGLLL